MTLQNTLRFMMKIPHMYILFRKYTVGAARNCKVINYIEKLRLHAICNMCRR